MRLFNPLFPVDILAYMSYHKRVKWKIEYYIDELGEKPIEDFLINLDKEL